MGAATAVRAAGNGPAGDEVDQDLLARLRRIASARTDAPLARHTTFGIGGPADIFVTVRSAQQLADVTIAVRGAGVPLFVLGSGSNILIGDRGVRGVVIDNQAKAIDGPAERDGALTVIAESGASFAALARHLARDGYGGFEWACGIPGSLGGAVVYNAGAYGGSLSDVLLAVTILDAANETRRLPASDLGLSYRTSAVLRGEIPGCVVLSVELAVTRGEPAALLAKIAAIDADRLAAQPRGRTGGSTFKNPPGHHAWELIDAVGLRGHRIGGARISEKHCNFFMNTGDATAADVFALMQEARRRVRERFGIELENEVELIGEGFDG